MTIKTSSGVGLIEVLVALFVLSVGLLGMAGLQLTGLKNNYSAQNRTEAALLAGNILDRMRLNRAVARAGGYDMTLGGSPPEGRNLEDRDRAQWLTMLSSNLPSGKGGIRTTAGVTVITIQWDDSRGTAGRRAQTFTLGSVL